jgi:hypothetical protein
MLYWADWRELIVAIGKGVEKIAGQPRSTGREEALEFYRGALGEFEAFKDAYRNSVMHSRKSYDEHAAMSVMTHVREFMQRLSAKLDERGRAIRWRTK